MKQQFLFSFKALLKSKKFFYCLVFVILAAFLLEFLMCKDVDKLYLTGDPNRAYFFISADYSYIRNLFLLVLPLVSILPYGDSYYKEKTFINQILTRTSKMKYLLVNSIMAFMTAFLLIFIFMVFTYYFNYLFLKSSIDNPFYFTFTDFSENRVITLTSFPLFTKVLFYNSTLYIFLYMIILSTYAGLISLMSYSISLWVKFKIISYLTPFALVIIPLPISAFLPTIISQWTPHRVFSPNSGQIYHQEFAVVFWVILFLVISIASNIYMYRRDVLE